jgi:PAS domain S-box-containing protein
MTRRDPAPEDRDEDLRGDIARARRRIAELRAAAPRTPPSARPLLPEALEELAATVEELQVAEEELRVQNDELAATREALERERQRYHHLFEFAPDAYLVTDREGTVVQGNRRALELFQTGARYLSGKPFVLFVDPPYRRAFHRLLSELAAQPEPREWDARLRRRGHGAFDAALRVDVSAARDGGFPELRWLVRDVSRTRRAERELVASNLDLERRVAERTAALEEAHRRLLNSLRLAEEAHAEAQAASRTKDDFLATISHELRTPLNAMSAWLYLLRTNRLDGEQSRHALETIQAGLTSLTQILQDLMDVSRITRGTLEIQSRPTPLAQVVHEAVDTLRPAAEVRSIGLDVRLSPEVGVAMVDAERMRQVVWNLLSNSIKYSPPGRRVDVCMDRTAGPDGPVARLVVQDEGIGIDSEALPHVFEPFRQMESGVEGRRGGLGLGLAVVRSLVELHGGRVWAESPGRGQGARFTVELPLAE